MPAVSVVIRSISTRLPTPGLRSDGRRLFRRSGRGHAGTTSRRTHALGVVRRVSGGGGSGRHHSVSPAAAIKISVRVASLTAFITTAAVTTYVANGQAESGRHRSEDGLPV